MIHITDDINYFISPILFRLLISYNIITLTHYSLMLLYS